MPTIDGELLILSGPHGAGKDSVEKGLRQICPDITRIVRHITREASNDEVDGIDYHFIARNRFQQMITEDDFLEYAVYPDVMSGTSYDAIRKALSQSHYATLTLNMEDALLLPDKVKELGIKSKSFFISPVSEGVFHLDESIYIAALRKRMEARRRPDDRIDNKLAKAALYRTLYFNQADEFIFVHNADSRLELAARSIMDICTTFDTN